MDMPELWSSVRDEGGVPRTSRVRAKKRVQDIHVWMQCYAVYVSVRSLKSPSLVPELMAYMVGILRASMEYEGTAWTSYDAAFRRQAAGSHAVVDSLYTICFTGRAKRMGRCELCLSSAHRHDECPLVADEDPDIGRQWSQWWWPFQQVVRVLSISRRHRKYACYSMTAAASSVTASIGTCVDCVRGGTLQWSARRRRRGGPSQHEGLSGGSRQRGQEGLQTHTELGIWTCVVVLSDVSG